METETLARLIELKHGVLFQLRGLAERQRTVVDEDELSALLGLLAAKQRLLDALQTVEKELAPFRGQDPERRRWRSAAERQRVRGLAEQCESLLAEIVQLETQSEQELLRRRDAAADGLQGTHRAAEACRAYSTLRGRSGSQLDVSSDT
jgi:hypothetical protein